MMNDSSWIRNKLFPVSIKKAWITLALEAYIEILFAVIISFRMFRIREVMNNWDRFAAACQMTGIATVIGFFLFVCWFGCVK